jgi:hypothetical protein
MHIVLGPYPLCITCVIKQTTVSKFHDLTITVYRVSDRRVHGIRRSTKMEKGIVKLNCVSRSCER